MHPQPPNQHSVNPDVRDTHVRALAWLTFILLIVNTAMVVYVFHVTHKLVEAMAAFGQAFG